MGVVASSANAQTGVSDDRVSLPEGAGSVGGIGATGASRGNDGLWTQSIPFSTPAGHRGLKPELAISYSSGGGSSVVGVGWRLRSPAISRLTRRGLPTYTDADEFVAEGELVRIPNTSPPTYRARFEGGFVRYQWHGSAASGGAQGYWTAEYPDGTIGYFGASASGQLVPEARVGSNAGTFRYHLVTTVDRFGHHVDFTYGKFGNFALPLQVAWVFDTSGTPFYSATFNYGDRSDPVLDATMGFVERLDKRLEQVTVFAGGATLRQYALTYEDDADSGGITRLKSVGLIGSDGSAHPDVTQFQYSKALGAACSGDACTLPYVRSVGSLGVDVSTGNTTLVDLNGDGVPDVVDTSQLGEPHTLIMGQVDADGNHTLLPGAPSAVGTQSGHDLSTAAVQALDINGDGFTDLFNAQQGTVLMNYGAGDWDPTVLSLWDGDGGLPGEFALGEGELQTIKFLDYDGDRRIDIIRSIGEGDANVTEVYRNMEAGGFQQDPSVAPIGAAFDTGRLEFNDINGDGLLDPIEVLPSSVRYKINLGRGQWEPAAPTEWNEITGFSFSDTEAVSAELEDINGDGLADLVLVSGNTIRYWQNRSGLSFDGEQTITSADVDGDLPVKSSDVTTLFADMNGNGSSDVVWITSSGAMTYLELFPDRPNLMVGVTTGLGKVTNISYASTVQERAAAQTPWQHPLPFPMTVVKTVAAADTLTDIVQTTGYTYSDGFYDGEEKSFQGYGAVQERVDGDASSDDGVTVSVFDVGVDDPYMAGRALGQEFRSGDTSIRATETAYSECTVAQVPQPGDADYGLMRFPVRFLCPTAQTEERREGKPSSQWVTVRKETHYDAYGNPRWTADLGIVPTDGAGCQPCAESGYTGTPCGAQCLGDETYRAVDFTNPESNDGRWILNLPYRTRDFGVADASGEPASEVYTERLGYYDGPDFEGLALGKATAGALKKLTLRLDADGNVHVHERSATDNHGALIAQLRPSGDPNQPAGQRRWVRGPLGLRATAAEFDMGDFVLRREYTYDPLWLEPASSTAWMKIVAGESVATPSVTHYAYDAFGRVAAIARPGATLDKPSERFTYEQQGAVSTVITESRSQADGPIDIRSVVCIDPRGRAFQRRSWVGGSEYQLSAHTVFNVRGDPYLTYPARVGTGESCDETPIATTDPTTYLYDGLGRLVSTLHPATHDESENPTTVHEYGPDYVREFDVEDTDPDSPHFDTPTTTYLNGLEQVVGVERMSSAAGTSLAHHHHYDELGNLVRLVDPAGNDQVQGYDFVGRPVWSDDDARGLRTYEYDEDGHESRVTDASGVVQRKAYDAAGRLIRHWIEADAEGTRIDYFWDEAPDCPECTHGAGQLVGSRFPVGAGEFGTSLLGYDLGRNIVFAQQAIHDQRYTTRSEYDHAGRAISDTYPTGDVVTRTFDGLSRVTAIPGYVDAVAYGSFGSVDTVTFSNATSQSWTFDARQRLSAVDVDGPSGALLSLALARDHIGNIRSVAEATTATQGASHAAAFEYDAHYRLTHATLDPGRAAFEESITYQLDGANRLLSKVSSRGAASEAHVGDYAYEGASALAATSAGAHTMSYDATGNLVARDQAGFSYDGFGRLTSAQRDGKTVSSFGYDDTGWRVFARTEDATTYYAGPGFEVRDGVGVVWLSIGRTRFVSLSRDDFASQTLSDLAPLTGGVTPTPSPNGEIEAADAWVAYAMATAMLVVDDAPPPSDVLTLLDASNARLLRGTTKGAQTRFHHVDYRGNTVLTTDAAGEPVDRVLYHPYGTIRAQDGSEPTYGYSGKEREAGLGLVYFGGRYLDPAVGRWVTPDPKFDGLTSASGEFYNEASVVYGYNQADPVNYRDDTGHFANVVFGAIAGGIVGAAEQYAIYKAEGTNIGWKEAGWIGVAAVTGAAWGGLTGGLSVVGTLLSTVINSGIAYVRKHPQRFGINTAASALQPLTQQRRSFLYRLVGQVGANVVKFATTGDVFTLAASVGAGIWAGSNFLLIKSTGRSLSGWSSVALRATGKALKKGTVGLVRGVGAFVSNRAAKYKAARRRAQARKRLRRQQRAERRQQRAAARAAAKQAKAAPH